MGLMQSYNRGGQRREEQSGVPHPTLGELMPSGHPWSGFVDRQDKASYEDLGTSTWAGKGPGMGQEGRSTSSKETQGHSYPRAPRTTCLGWDS